MGGGIFYYTYGIVTNPSTGYSYTNALVATNDSNLTPYATLGNPFPDGLKQPRGAADGVNTNLGQSISFSNTNFQNQYSLRGSFDVQHQLTKDTVVQLGYIGSHSVRLLVNQPLAYLPTQYLSKSPVRDQPVIDALSKTYTNPMAGLLPGSTLNGSTLSLGNLLRTYPEYTGVTLNNSNAGGSYFHQFAARLQRRLSNGLSFMMNFQHSRLMEQISYLNNGDPTLEKRVSSSDRPNRLTFAGTWEIPVGKGRHFLSNTNRLVNGVVGGWMFSPTLSLQSGTPIAWGNLIYFGGNLNWDPRNVSHVFDPSVFETNSGKQPSQNFRTFPTQFNNLRSDSTSNVNLTLTKSFRIRERFKITYRAESFNLFNRAQFSAPALDPAKTTAGVVTAQSNNPRIIQMALKISF